MNKKGQSVLEYVIILCAIIAVILTFAYGVLKPKIQAKLKVAGDAMETGVKHISFP